MAKRWYVLHVYAGFDKKSATQIFEQAEHTGLRDHIDDIVVPTEEVVEIRRAQKVNA
jgi:transcriptional antiterminator NusG